MQFNWIDLIILVVVVFYVIDGWEVGIWKQAVGLVSFLGSLWLAVRYHLVAGEFIASKFGISPLWSQVLGYAVVAFGAEILIGKLLVFLVRRLPKKVITAAANKWLGATLSAAKALVIVTLMLLLISALPLRGTIHPDIKASRIGQLLVTLAGQYGGGVKQSLDQTAKDVVRFLTVKPKSDERVSLEAELPQNLRLTVNEEAEKQLTELVNKERVKAGVKPVKVASAIIPVARAHSRDMFVRRYFSHVSPEGRDAGDRLTSAGVPYHIAGENLAYAPDVATAHEGLMNSEGHRKNILTPEFGRIGIGVIDAGVYGMMFTQVFTD